MADKENQFQGVVESLLKGMDTVLSTKTVVGEATKVGDTIILPLVDVTFGVGAGAKNDSQCSSGYQGRFHKACEYQESGCCDKGSGYGAGFGGEVYEAQGENRNVRCGSC